MEIRPDIDGILKNLMKDYQLYAVGGCVRDYIMGRNIKDYDFTTDATPEDLKNIFSGYSTITAGENYGTIIVIINGECVEITTMRKDGSYYDGRHPQEVTYTSNIYDDLARRDFTMNAIAWDVHQHRFIDPYNGEEYCREELIKAVGNPDQRFREDALRMLRAIRFVGQLDFFVEEETLLAIHRNKELIHNVAPERIQDELCQILASPGRARALKYLEHTGVLFEIIPEFEDCQFDNVGEHHTKNVIDHIFTTVDNCRHDIILRLAALFHDIGKPSTASMDDDGNVRFYGHQKVSAQMTKDIMTRLKFSNMMIDKVTQLVEYHMALLNPMKKPGLRRLMEKVGKDNMIRLFQLRAADIMASKVTNMDWLKELQRMGDLYIEILKDKDPICGTDLAIDGYDLMRSFGGTSGKWVGEVKTHLLEIVLDDPTLNRPEILLEKAREFLNGRSFE